jgi:hypothetical protein
MRLPRRQPFEVLSISALDIFASSLGVFILMAILMFPYYLKQPAQEAEAAAAAAARAAAEARESGAATALEAASQVSSAAAARLAALEARRAELEAALAELPATRPDARTGRQVSPLSIQDLDLVFVLDTTQSMGRVLDDLRAEMIGLIKVLGRLATSLRVGIVAFKDRGDAYLTRSKPLSPLGAADGPALLTFLETIDAEGGGDLPEPVDQALEVAIGFAWRPDAEGRIIVIGDAPARDRARTLTLAQGFRRSAGDPSLPRRVAAIYTGGEPDTRAFFERIAAMGGGDFSVHRGQIMESVLLAVLGGDRL